MPASPTFNAPTQHQSDGAEKISSGPHFPSFTVDPRSIMTAVEMPSASFVLNNIPVEHPSVQSMFAPGVPAAPRCLLCCQHGHWYSRCRLFNGKQVCFFNERDHRVIVMDRDDWICGTVLADVFRFLRPITGLTPSQYHLIIHQQKVIAPRDTPCCDIGILPGAYVSVMVVDSFRYLLCPPSVIALRDQLRVHRHHHDDQQQQTADTCMAPLESPAVPLPPSSQSVASDAPSQLALETETNQPSKEDESESTYDGNVSHISVASTSLMQSVPGTENSRLVVESEGVAETTTTTTVSEDGAVPPAPEAAMLLHNSSTNTTAVSVVEASANESCGSVVVYLDRPSGIAAWADLSVGSIHSRHTPPQMLSGDNETKKNTAAAAATPGNAMSTPKPSVDAQNRLSRPGTKTVTSKGKDDDDHHHHHKEDPATVNVKFLPATMSFADMRAMFFSVGEVLKVRVVSPSDDEVPVEQRFSVAFVEYKYREDALQFISTYHRHRCGRFQLRVEMSKKGILGGYITDAVGDYPCTFGLPQSMVKVRGSDKSVDACGASSIATAAGTTPSRKSTNAANTSAHKSPSSSRHQRGALDTTDGGAYKLTPKVRSPKTMQQYASSLQQEFSTPVRRPTSCRNGDDDIEGAHPPTIAKATTTGELLLLQHDKAIVGISNRALVARSGDDEGSHFRRPRAVISAQVGLLKNFSTVRNTIDEYLATGVEATFYNALRQLEELSTRFRLSPGYADTSSVLNRSNGGDTTSTTATTTTSAALPSVRIDILVLRCALVIHYGASKTIDEYLSDIVAEIVSMTERTSIMESNRWTDLDGVHLVESLLTAAALIQRRRPKVSRMLISQCRALVSSNMVAGLDNRRRKSISRLCDDNNNNNNKQKEEDCRVRPLWEYLFPNVLSEWSDGSIDAHEVAGACAQEVLQMQPTMDFGLAL